MPKKLGEVDVDSGTILVVDPCYLRDRMNAEGQEWLDRVCRDLGTVQVKGYAHCCVVTTPNGDKKLTVISTNAGDIVVTDDLEYWADE